MASASVSFFDTQIPKETRQFSWRVTNFKDIRCSMELLKACNIQLDMGKDIGFHCTFRARLVESHGCSGLGVQIDLEWLPRHATVVMMKWNGLRVGNALSELHCAGQPQDYRKRGWEVKVNQAFSGYSGSLIHSFGRYNNGYHGNENGLLEPDGSLRIDFELTLYNVDGSAPARPTAPAPPPPTISLPSLASVKVYFHSQFLSNLSHDMGKLALEPIASAGAPEMVRLISRDGMEFPVNWPILAARSPVFKAMFQTRMTEVQRGVVKLDDIGGSGLRVFLHFLHSGTLLENWMYSGVLQDLVYAADKYLMNDLLNFLDEALGFLCTQHNCGMLLRLAQQFELKTAEKMVLEKYRALWNQATGLEEMKCLVENMDIGLNE